MICVELTIFTWLVSIMMLLVSLNLLKPAEATTHKSKQNRESLICVHFNLQLSFLQVGLHSKV